MNILLYKDGRLLIDEGNPMEGVSLDGLAVCITDPTEGQVLTYNGTMWVNQDATGLVADVSEPTEGQVLTYDGTKWTNANLPTPESEPAAGGEG